MRDLEPLPSTARRWLLPALLATLAFLPFLPGLLGDGVFVARDHLAHFLPKRWILARVLSGEASALWNPWIAAGTPFLADPQSGLFYPPALLSFSLLPFRVAYQLYPALHVALAGLGMYWLLRCQRVGRAGAFFGGLVFQWSGFTFSLVGLTNNLCSYSWVPIALACTWRSAEAEAGRRRWSVMAGVSLTACFLAGEPQIAAFTAIMSAVLAMIRSRELTGSFSRGVKIVSWMAVVAAGLSAPQSFPMVIWVAQTRRILGVGLEQLAADSLHLTELLDLISPAAFQTDDGRKWIGAQSYLSTIYVGWLSLFSIIWLNRRDGSRLWFFFLCIFIGIALGLGYFLPGYSFLYEHFGFASFRYPSRFIFIALTSIAILAGHGFDRLLSELAANTRIPAWRALLPASIAASLTAIIALGPWSWPAAVRVGVASGIVRGLLLVAAAGALVLLSSKSRIGPRTTVALLLTLAGADLLLYQRTGFVTAPIGELLKQPVLAESLAPGPAGAPPRVLSAIDPRALHAFAYGNEQQPLASARRISGLLSPTVSALFGIAETSRDGVYPTRTYEPIHGFLHSGVHPGLEQWMGIRMRITLPSSKEAGEPAAQPIVQLIDSEASPLRLAEAAPGGDTVTSILEFLSDRNRPIELGIPVPSSQTAAPWSEPGDRCAERGKVHLLEWRSHDLLASVELPCPAILVHTSTLLPGWSVTLDGREAPLFPALGAFQAVWVPSGRHEIRFEYWPAGLTTGLWIAVGTLLLILVSLSRRSPRPMHLADPLEERLPVHVSDR